MRIASLDKYLEDMTEIAGKDPRTGKLLKKDETEGVTRGGQHPPF